MTKPLLPPLVIIADFPEALTMLGGISLLERLRRIIWQIGFREATVLSNSVESVAGHLRRAWPAADVSLKLFQRAEAGVTVGDVQNCLAAVTVPHEQRLLCVFAGFYCDLRLLRALIASPRDSVVVDSSPPFFMAPLGQDIGRAPCAALLSHQWFKERDNNRELLHELVKSLTAGHIAAVDAAQQETYVRNMRRSLRPIFFPAPSPETRPVAERLLLDATQKGVLDFPALVHAPIEKWIVSHLCRTSITPNQVTLLSALLGLSVTLLYAFGYLGRGVLLALFFGILDGVDGKLARLKVQTTRIGHAEHTLDYCIEMSWWAALAYHFQVTGQVRGAYALWLLFFSFDVLDRFARWSLERKLGRSRDDISRFDRLFRYVSGRRNIYTWLFAFYLVIGQPAAGFVFLCAWGIVTAVIHMFRFIQIRSA